MNQLFLFNGISTSQVQIFNVDDAEFLTQQSESNAMLSITQSMHKCQYVIYSEKSHPKLKKFESYFMQPKRTVSM